MCLSPASGAPGILVDGTDAIGPLSDQGRNCAQVVIGTFNAAFGIAGKLTSFEAAVQVYRERYRSMCRRSESRSGEDHHPSGYRAPTSHLPIADIGARSVPRGGFVGGANAAGTSIRSALAHDR